MLGHGYGGTVNTGLGGATQLDGNDAVEINRMAKLASGAHRDSIAPTD